MLVITTFSINIFFIYVNIICELWSCLLWVSTLSSSLLCRAARGSADIPILPHAHTILLKHAVNLKRRRTLFSSKPCFHQPIVLPTWGCHMNIGFSQNPSAYRTSCGPKMAPVWCNSSISDFINWSLFYEAYFYGGVDCCLRGDSPLFFSSTTFKRWLSH